MNVGARFSSGGGSGGGGGGAGGRSGSGVGGMRVGGRSVVYGTIDSRLIYNTHTQLKSLVLSYKDLNFRVSEITSEVEENWVGKGRNEFESQYKLLIRKIEDFGDTLKDIYEALVEAEAAYRDADDDIRQDYVMSINS